MDEFSLIVLGDENKYICDICNSQEEFLLCENCFKKYNSAFEENINNFKTTGKELSKKIESLLNFNKYKSQYLNKRIKSDKYKPVMESRIKQEEMMISVYKEEHQKYQNMIIKQKDKNVRLSTILKDLEKENKTDEIKNDSINSVINFSAIDFNNNKNDIIKLKNEISDINKKIKNIKINYIKKLFKKLFIDKNNIIKVSDFFKDKQFQENNFSIIFLNANNNQIKSSNNENPDNSDNTTDKEINLNVLGENNRILKRFNSFFITMISFLEKSYKRFKIEMPFKINNSKIEYKNGFEYNLELNNLNEESIIKSCTKGYHLLNINFMSLMQNIFGDSEKLGNWFDISLLLDGKDEDIGSIEKIREEEKNNKEGEFNGFIIIDG